MPGTRSSTLDAVIVGGGFAGVVAARELTMRGRSAVLVEARDRLGGRTHTASHGGHELELGGTWIHPTQPNVWAEVTRYGLELEELPLPGARQAVMSQGRVVELRGGGMGRVLEALARFCAPAATAFPAPYTEAPGTDPERYGDRSMREVLDSLQLEPVLRDTLDAICSTVSSAPLDQAAASEMLRVYALSGSSPVQMFAALSSVKIASGTASLIDAIVSQATLTEVRLSSPVSRVVQTGDGVRVELRGAKEVTARTALITLPMNVLDTVAFEPQLSAGKRAAARERHAGSGLKCYVEVAGDIGNVSVFAPETEPINWAGTHHHGPQGSLLIVFGNDPKRLPLDDVATMQLAVRRLLPGARVESVFGWDWARDPLALGTWCVLRPGQPGRLLPELRRSEGRVFFASGDSAIAWRGCIDGAIESGYRAAREIDDYLRA
jgi:monoamine oxidase